MKTRTCQLPHHLAVAGLLIAASLPFSGCGRRAAVSTAPIVDPTPKLDSLAIALAPHDGGSPLDERIRRSQEQVRTVTHPQTALEQLGWLYISKARASFDAGFYTLAEQCALALDARQPGGSEALLLRGHALHSQHRFKEAESLARQLVAKRGLAFDHGLLGDILADVGRVDDAAGAYQKMIDLRPDPQGYARVAHVRWLKGDLEGAVEAMRVAAAGASPRDADSAAWMNTQLSRYLWQSGDFTGAEGALRIALGFQTNYAPGLLLRGRMRLSTGRNDDALPSLRQAAQINPLPEYHWALAEALRAAHREDEAIAEELQISSRGPATDPRTCSLYLATRRTNSELAVRLARQELAERQDALTHDALAWALAAAGQLEEAQAHLRLALAQGTADARLSFHAAALSAQAGRLREAGAWLAKASALQTLLLPSEHAQLQSVAKLLSASTTGPAASLPTFPTAATSGAASEN